MVRGDEGFAAAADDTLAAVLAVWRDRPGAGLALRAWLAEEKAAERNSHQRWQSYCRRHRQDAHGDLDR